MAVPQMLDYLAHDAMRSEDAHNDRARTRARPLPTDATQGDSQQDQEHWKREPDRMVQLVGVRKPGRLRRTSNPVEAPQLQEHR